jgi:hypothetical protein
MLCLRNFMQRATEQLPVQDMLVAVGTASRLHSTRPLILLELFHTVTDTGMCWKGCSTL